MIHKYIIIPKEKLEEANSYCNSIGAEGKTFSTPLYTSGEISHYWTGWLMTPKQLKSMELFSEAQLFNSYHDVLDATGLEIHFESEE